MLNDVITWSNENQGVVTILIFVVTLFLGWASGIFASLRRKPKLKIDALAGPTQCATFLTGEKYEGYDVHRTAISLYLRITNVGSASASVEDVWLGYHWHLRPFSLDWVRYRIFWHWIKYQTIAIEDFQVKIGENIKFYPSLFQRSSISGSHADTYLEPGRAVNGVVYFEQNESWGGCFPAPKAGRTRVKVAVVDSFGTRHKKSFWIPIVTLDQAKKYNPSFGDTLPTLHNNTSLTSTASGHDAQG